MLLIASASFTLLRAQVDTVTLTGKNRLITSQLRPELNQYLVYFQTAKQNKALRFWFWSRNIETAVRNNKKVFVITQQWYTQDTSNYRSITSVNSANDFTPLYHAETVGNKTKAYNWTDKKIVGDDTVTNNLAKTFALDFTAPNFNWNLDIETFEMLPLAEKKSFVINFYDAGIDEPKYVLYKVTGSETLTLYNKAKVDCWKLATEGKMPNGSTYSQIFWIGKKTHEFLKEEDAFDGNYRYKVKLFADSPDLSEHFQ